VVSLEVKKPGTNGEGTMKKLIGISAMVMLFALGAFAQSQRMGPEDQDHFNSFYARWQQDRQTSNRDDMLAMEQRMQDLMSRYSIPTNTPYSEIAEQNPTPRDDRDRAYANAPAYSQVQMSTDDQRKYDEEYRKWQDSIAKNDRDDIDKHARKMREIMSRYNIGENTPFDAFVSSNGYSRSRYSDREFQNRLQPEDQKKFDKAYEHWLHERHENDRDGMAKEEGKMQEIMARYNIPRDVPYTAIVSGGRP
jgi:hypothetical protein